MSRKSPPERSAYSSGGGAGSRLEMRTRWTSPIAPAATASRTDWCAGSKRRLKPTWNRTPGALDGRERPVDLGEVERDRLLAEDRLARRAPPRRSASTWVSVLVQIAIASTSPSRAARRRLAPPGRRAARATGCGELGSDVVDGGQRRSGDAAGEQLGVHARRSARVPRTPIAHRRVALAVTSRLAAARLPSQHAARAPPATSARSDTSATPTSQNAPPGVQRFGRRLDRDHRRAVGGPRALERVLELRDRPHRLGVAAERRARARPSRP